MDNIRLIFLLLSFLVFVATVIAKSETHYEVLGVDEKASLKEIKKEYKTLAKKYHPDKLTKEQKKSKAKVDRQQEKFIKIKTAYEELSDPAKRKKYDRQLQMERSGFGGFQSEGHQRFGGDSMFGGDFFMHFDPFQGDDFGDSIFGSFGSQFMEPQVNRWSDHDDSHYHAQFHHGGHQMHHGHGHRQAHGHASHGHASHGQNCQVFVERIGNTVRKTVNCF